MNIKTLTSVVSFFCLGLTAAYAVEVSTTDNVESDSDFTIEVPEGTTNIYSGKLTLTGTAKLIKTGLGMLALANGENTFEGGIAINKGAIRADAEGSLGEGAITIAQGATNRGQLFYNAEGATFNNPTITVTGTYNNGLDYAAIQAIKSTTIYANITANNGVHLGNYPINGTSNNGVANTQSTIFNGSINSSTKNEIALRSYGTLEFNGALTCSNLRVSTVASNRGKVYLNNTANSIGGINTYNSGAIARCENAFGGAYITHSYGTTSSLNTFDMAGYNQILQFLRVKITSSTVLSTKTSTGCNITSSRPAILKLIGSSNDEIEYGDFRICDKVTLSCDFTNPNFTQVISNRTHTATDLLEVKRGKLALYGTTSWPSLKQLKIDEAGVVEVDSTETLVFKSVTNLNLAGKLSFSAEMLNPFNGSEMVLNLTDTAELCLPEGMTIPVKMVKVNGRRIALGLYNSENLPQIKRGQIDALQMSDPVDAVWTDAAEDHLTSTLGNWTVNGVVPEELDVEDGSVSAYIGNDGNSLIPDGAVKFSKIVYTREKTLSPFTLGDADKEITLLGAGNFVGAAQVILRGKISTPSHADQGPAEKNGVSTLYISGATWPNATLPAEIPDDSIVGSSDRLLPTILDGVTIEKPIYYIPGTTAGGQLFYAMPDTYNLLKGEVYWGSSWSYLDICDNATIEFAGGVKAGTRAYLLKSNSSTLKISGKPATFSGGITLSAGKLVLDIEGNCFIESDTAKGGIYVNGDAKQSGVEFKRSYCFTEDGLQQLYVAGKGAKTIELNDTMQKVSRFLGGSTNSRSELRGQYPATLEICGGGRSGKVLGAFAEQRCSMQINGWVGFHYLGTGKSPVEGILDGDQDTYLLRGKDFNSYGDLEVDAGTLEVASDATWLNGTNMTARGSGTLKIGKGKTFGRQAILRLVDEGRFVLPVGASQRVSECWVDGVKIADGTYEAASLAAESPLKDRLVGGTLVVKPVGGFSLIVR